jgi:hypothetical protein
MLGKPRWLSLAMVVVLTTIGLGASAGADSGSEQGFLSAINSSRSSAGLPPVSMDGSLQSHARNHTAAMIAAGEIFHSTSGELQAAAGSGWSKLGENVGRGGTVSSLHEAFMNSSGHRANILGDYNYVGIGTDANSGVLYVTVVFMKKGGGSSSPSPTTTAPPKSSETTKGSGPTKSAPTPTTVPPTATTVPPTTTTTLIVGPDKPVTPGESCYTATRLWWMCHD